MTNPASPAAIEVGMTFEGVSLDGSLAVPERAKGLVVFAHGSGSSRFSRRNRFVAGILNEAGLATLLFDLLTSDEEDIDLHTREFRFDIELLTSRLIGVVDWASQNATTAGFAVGLFGASTGAAAALGAAAARAGKVAAVVSRGGRPDLALRHLAMVRAPTLLIVGGEDTVIIGLNQQAASYLQAKHRLEIVPGATHLFEEPGTLEQVAKLTSDWFLRYLSGS
ncbi:dienelactone hydrolase family protein [Methylobacter sp. YRD-M1]|uniref:dienelactone hydrolase family protein n=1 Tax=Methylobacter sp. YRD-M1 TaxID=2911520 RepID=UPI00227B8E71|nr:dienelactone hydrolase family protein [Methylobacter sp. YRD-M1]WAK01280.1 dienelactone hydrolase family protein [Methylobacter sp. YRD-M1]